MHTDKNLQFITDRILETNVALFHCHTSSLLRIPTNVVNTYKVDENGCIWFYMPRPKQLISQFDKEFPVGLNYFKKGNNYSMNIYGKAIIIDDPEELISLDLSKEEIDKALNEQLLISVKIMKVDYFDHDQEKKNSFFRKVKSFIYELFDYAEPDGKSYEFTPTAGMHNYGF